MKILFACVFALCAALSGAAQSVEKPRVFIEQSQSWSASGGNGGLVVTGGVIIGGGGGGRGGARPQTAEIIKTFNERCRQCIVTSNKEKADYVVLLEHEGGKRGLRRDNKFALFNKDGDAVTSGSTRVLGNAVKDVCAAIAEDWRGRRQTGETQ